MLDCAEAARACGAASLARRYFGDTRVELFLKSHLNSIGCDFQDSFLKFSSGRHNIFQEKKLVEFRSVKISNATLEYILTHWIG